MRPFDEWSFNELVDHCAGEILKALLRGSFRTEVFSCLDLAIRWSREQDKPKKRKDSK